MPKKHSKKFCNLALGDPVIMPDHIVHLVFFLQLVQQHFPQPIRRFIPSIPPSSVVSRDATHVPAFK